jgi:serine/threonine protein kinase
MESPSPTARQVFERAVDIELPAERETYVAQACAGLPDLKHAVEALLRAHEKSGTFLETPATDFSATAYQPVHEGPGTTIGPYKLLQKLGEGGMGTVFMAEQTQPVERKVALKIIKPGMDSRHVLARFAAEQHALALMEHPNIAKVLDAGTTDSGRPYFVMELVKGVPITQYCDQRHLSPRQRLELFIPICQAVQHAHQKGIIHRDLKPSNVLIALYDNRPVPKVIDFGVAKATGARLTEHTLFTEFGQMLGTVEYMSPEQAGLNQLDIDTRSDIYSLGVLLYELLTGTTPLEHQRIKTAALLEVLRLVREEEPPKPSTRLSTAAQLPSISANRGLEPKKLSVLVRGELDWIVMKALEKDRARRYETASALARDIERYLNDESVEACPPSARYRFGKFVRGHKVGFAAGLFLGLAMLLAVVALLVHNRLITREKDQKEAALAQSLQEKQRADQNLARARQAVKEYLVKIAGSPLLATGDFQPLRKELFETVIPFYEQFAQQEQRDPSLDFERGRVYEDLGFLRMNLSEPERALVELEKAEAIYLRLSKTFPGQPKYRHQLADTYNVHGGVFRDLGRAEAAVATLGQALALFEALAAEPGAPPESLEFVARVAMNLGVQLKDLGQAPESEAMLRKAIAGFDTLLKRQPESIYGREDLAMAWLNVGVLLGSQRQRAEEAEAAYQKCLDLLSADWVQHLQASPTLAARFQSLRAGALGNIGALRANAGRWDQAEQSFRESLPIKQKLVEMFPSNPSYRRSLAQSYGNLASALDSLHRAEEARAMHDRAIGLYEQLVAESPANVRYVLELASEYFNVADAMVELGQLEPALPILTKTIETLERSFRREPRAIEVRETLALSYRTRAEALAKLDRFPEAVQDLDRAIELGHAPIPTEVRLQRASCLLKMKDHARAAADAATVAADPAATANDVYNAACVNALASKLALDDAALAESYAARAVLVLRQAHAKGFQDAAAINADADFDAIRSREDFQKLFKEWDAKSPPTTDRSLP